MDPPTPASAQAAKKFSLSNLDELIAAVKDPTIGFVVKDRSYHFKKYPQCFVAEEAVKWIREHVEVRFSKRSRKYRF